MSKTPGQEWREKAQLYDIPAAQIERMAKGAYMANHKELPTGRFPPVWESASEEVRDWMRNQIVGALIA